jgi:hypothetical protein
LLLSNGLNVSPLKSGEQGQGRSMREAVSAINNEKDLSDYVSSFANKLGRQNVDITYEKHPVSEPRLKYFPCMLSVVSDIRWFDGPKCTTSTTSTRSFSILRFSTRASNVIFWYNSTTTSSCSPNSCQSTFQSITGIWCATTREKLQPRPLSTWADERSTEIARRPTTFKL